MERGVGLDEHLAGHVAAPRAPGHLRQQLERALRGAEVRHLQAQVGVDHADQGHVRKVEALGDHLRADQNIDVAAPELAEDLRVGILAAGGVGVHAHDARVREDLLHGGLDALGADAGHLDVGRAAFGIGAARRHRLDRSADVADHMVRRLVVGHLHAAVRTGLDVAADGAHHGGGVAAAVQEQHGLLALREAQADGLDQLLREQVRGAGLLGLDAHVHDAHDRHRAAVHALGQLGQPVLAGARVAVGFERGRGAAEHDGAVFEVAAHDGDVARAVARGFVLLVGGLVLLVHHQQAQRAHGREERAARADDDARLAGGDAPPFVVALAVGEMAVQDGDDVAEAPAEALHGLGREGDFRHEGDGPLPRVQRGLDGGEIDFRLAAAGHAVQQHDARLGRGHFRADGGERRFLLVRQRRGRRGQDRQPDVGIAADHAFFQRNPALLFEAAQAVEGHAGFLRQRGGGRFAALFQRGPGGGLLGAFLRQRGLFLRGGRGLGADGGDELLLELGAVAAHGGGQHGGDGALERGGVVVGDPAREPQHRLVEQRQIGGDGLDGLQVREVGLLREADDEAAGAAPAEGHAHDAADPHLRGQLGGHAVVEFAVERELGEDPGDGKRHKTILQILGEVDHHAENEEDHGGGDDGIHGGEYRSFYVVRKNFRPVLRRT